MVLITAVGCAPQFVQNHMFLSTERVELNFTGFTPVQILADTVPINALAMPRTINKRTWINITALASVPKSTLALKRHRPTALGCYHDHDPSFNKPEFVGPRVLPWGAPGCSGWGGVRVTTARAHRLQAVARGCGPQCARSHLIC